MHIIKQIATGALAWVLIAQTAAAAADVSYTVSLKQPGQQARTYNLSPAADGTLRAADADGQLPLDIRQQQIQTADGLLLTLTVSARSQAYFNLEAVLPTDFATEQCEFYLPGFWYHKNLRSPREAPSFHTSQDWTFREDRLSSPLVGVFSSQSRQTITVLRLGDTSADALTTHQEGEVILGGPTSVGFLGFAGSSGRADLTFGYPYKETPQRYIRKLTLTPPITTFARLDAGRQIELRWLITEGQAADFGQFVAKTWQHCVDRLNPQPVAPLYDAGQMKAQLSNYFREAYVDRYELKYHSGHTLRCDDCMPVSHVQLGFCGRVLLNAFNALEYGCQTGDTGLVRIANDVFDSWLHSGFTRRGYFRDDIDFSRGIPADDEIVHSIRQQSEAVYAVFHYLNFERRQGRRHAEWEQKMRNLLDQMLLLLADDGHLPRKFHDDHSEIDASGGSTPSATSTLVMGYKYFGDKRYLEAARRTVAYLERNIIAPSDYFSSTLDANCEDKEAAISAVTATYYLAMVTKKQERQHCIDLCQQAAYFALSWYYLWDVPFAQGQMLGDLGFHSRGWGNVSVENNHIDVFVFELPHIVRWLATVTDDGRRFDRVCEVIESSLNQLLPTPDRLCGIGKPGFYPEVVQHTNWDYGRNGKGFYNDIFAPGWTVASLWELYSPRRTADFLK